MSIYKRGTTYWYKFMFNGQLVQKSSRCRNGKTAADMEAAHRTMLAKGEVGSSIALMMFRRTA